MERMLIVLQGARSSSRFPASSPRPRPYSSTRNAGEKSLYRGRRERLSNHALSQSHRRVNTLPGTYLDSRISSFDNVESRKYRRLEHSIYFNTAAESVKNK